MNPIIPKRVIVVKHYIRSAARPDQRYIGMNYFAAQELKSPWCYAKDTAIVTDPSLNEGVYSYWTVPEVALHEQCEAWAMQTGMKYDEAHAETVRLVGPGWARK